MVWLEFIVEERREEVTNTSDSKIQDMTHGMKNSLYSFSVTGNIHEFYFASRFPRRKIWNNKSKSDERAREQKLKIKSLKHADRKIHP